MNARERIEAAVALEATDRVPVAPLLDHFAASYAGITNQELIEDPKKRIDAVVKTATELGPWDMTFMAEMANLTLLMGGPARLLRPGKELPPNEIHQYEEFELLTPDDYELFGRLGLTRFLRNVGLRLYPDMGGLKGFATIFKFLFEIRKSVKTVRAAGVEPAVGFIMPGPMIEYFSIGRSMGAMCEDLLDTPEKIKAVNMKWARSMTDTAIKFSSLVGVKRVFVGLSRSGPAFISPRLFEELVLPELEYMINTLIDAGKTPLLHCDTDWSICLKYFKRFPAKKCILDLDGATNMAAAHELLGDRMCIMGDVPATILAFGEKDEVVAHCTNLMKTVGAKGGFILSSGCSIPANAKTENVRAIAESAFDFKY